MEAPFQVAQSFNEDRYRILVEAITDYAIYRDGRVTSWPALTRSSHGKDRAMQTRRRFKQTTSLQDRLSEFIAGARAEAETAPDGADEYELQKKVRQAETAANIEAWANSPGLQPPK